MDISKCEAVEKKLSSSLTKADKKRRKLDLEALEGRVEVVGTSGHEVREDTLSAAGRAA